MSQRANGRAISAISAISAASDNLAEPPGGATRHISYHGGVRTRRLGHGTVTAIGGGDISLATSASRGVAAREVEGALVEAIDLGISLFDISADADSQRLAGDVVRTQRARDRVVLATHVPRLAAPSEPGRAGRDLLPTELPVRYVQDRVEAALRATRLDVLPLVQLPLRPAWLASTAWPELVGSCARLVREGKVLAWAALLEPGELPALRTAGEPPEREDRDDRDERREPPERDEPTAAALIAEPWLAALSVSYSACDRRAEAVFAAADARELPILARQPLAGGALAGSLGPGVTLPPRDDRGDLDAATLERIAIGVAALSVLVKRAPPAARSSEAGRRAIERAVRPDHLECHDVAELALRFAIDRVGRAGIALPRLHRRQHIVAALAAASAPPLSADLVARILDDLGGSPS